MRALAQTDLRTPLSFPEIVAVARDMAQADGRLDEPSYEIRDHKREHPEIVAALQQALRDWEAAMAHDSPAPQAIALPDR